MQEGETGMKNKKAENAITAVLVAAVLVTGGMSLHSYLSEQRAKNEYDAIRQELVAEMALFPGIGHQLSGGTGGGQ